MGKFYSVDDEFEVVYAIGVKEELFCIKDLLPNNSTPVTRIKKKKKKNNIRIKFYAPNTLHIPGFNFKLIEAIFNISLDIHDMHIIM